MSVVPAALRLCEGRVVVVTGAGRGLGRSHALELAREGALLLVNDSGVGADGEGGSAEPAHLVAEEIRSTGGEAVANTEDIGSWAGAKRVIGAAIEAFGRLDAVVNNAGILRDQMIVNLAEEDWHAVLGVHLDGHAAVTSQAAAYWRERAKAEGPSDWRIVNTTSPAGLSSSAGQAAYVAAKAAIAALTLVEADELSRYGVTANAIAPAARTRLTHARSQELTGEPALGSEITFDPLSPGNVSPLVAWLCSTASRGVNGRIFEVSGAHLSLMTGWRRATTFDGGDRPVAGDLRAIVDALIARADHPAS